MNILQRVFMNVSFKSLGEVGRKVIGFGFVVFLARALGDEGLGKYGFFLLYTNLFAMVADAGLNTLYARDASREPQNRQRIMSALILIKIILSTVTLIVLALVTYLLIAMGKINLSSADILPLALFALYWILNTMIDLVNAVYIERQRLGYDAAINLGHRALAVVLGIVLVLIFRNVFAVSASYVIAAVVSLVVTCSVVASRFKVMPYPSLRTGLVRHLLLEALPLIFSLFFSFVYFHIDIVMLRIFTTDAVVGWYVASFKILEFTMLLPGAAAMVILPLFAKQFAQDREQLVVMSGQIIRLLFGAGLFVAFVLVTLAGRIIPIFGKDFGPQSQLALQILVWTIPLIYVDYVLIYLLVASGHQRKNAIAAFFCALLNISLNYALIPYYSYKGAAVATVATQVLLMVLSAHFVRKPLPSFRMSKYILRVAAAGAFAGAALWLARGLGSDLQCAITLSVFAICLLLFKGVTKGDKGLLKQLLARGNASKQTTS